MLAAVRRGIWVGCALILALALPVTADAAAGSGRPKIGLALSGGGARGAAHVGVLRVLEEQHIPIDYIAGTSMGSIIGALYASGMTPDEIEASLQRVDWDGVFSDRTGREDRTFRRKQDDRTFLMQHKPGLKDGEIKLPMALVEGQKFDLVLRELLLPVVGIRDFDKLRIPFRAVATDIATGQEVVLSKGDLALAARASMAVPGAFAAVDIDGRTLVDGGMANNLPISVVRQMGADVVIAVDISTPLLTREEIGSILGVVEQLTGFLTRGNTERQIASLTPRDLLIVPPLDAAKIGSSDFKRSAEAIQIGEQAARGQLDRIAALGLPEAQYARHLHAHPNPRVDVPPMVRIDFVDIDNNSSVRNEVIAANFGVQAGDPMDLKRIEEGIGRVYGLDYFEKIGYTVAERDGKQGIRLQVREKSWGTSSAQLGLEMYSAFGDGSDFSIGGAVTIAPFGDNAGEWRTMASMGEEHRLITELYYPLDAAQRWFVAGDVGFESKLFRLFQNGDPQAEYDTSTAGVRLRGGYNIETWGRLQAQYERSVGDAEVNTGAPSLVDYEFDVGNLKLTAAVDTLDNFYFPREGQIGEITWNASREAFGASSDYDQIILNYNRAFSWGDHSLQGGVTFATTLDDNAPVEGMFRLGGFLRLSGLEMNALSGQHAALVRGVYRYRFNEKLVPLYAGASLELGNTWQFSNDISLNDAHWAGSLFLGADTPLGPAFLGYGHTDGDAGGDSMYLMLGTPWY